MPCYAYRKGQKLFQKPSNMKRKKEIFDMIGTYIHTEAKTDQHNIRYIIRYIILTSK